MTDPLPSRPPDWIPLALVPAVALLALPVLGSPATWLTLTVAGLSTGVILFTVASGLMLVFGLMDVMNFGHGALVAVGAAVGVATLAPLAPWTEAGSLGPNLAALGLAALSASLVAGLVGAVFDRLLIRPVGRDHLRQILTTTGGVIVVEELLKAIWGPEAHAVLPPQTLRGAILLGGAAVETYRLVALAVGVAVFAGLLLVLTRTRIGLLIRAGVENREMVEALGYRTRPLFVGVFVAGAALAGLGGLLWGVYLQTVTAAIGAGIQVLVFIVVIVGGLGSTTGCMIGALLVGLLTNYVGFAAPKLALFVNLLLMVGLLAWRPRGLYAVTSR